MSISFDIRKVIVLERVNARHIMHKLYHHDRLSNTCATMCAHVSCQFIPLWRRFECGGKSAPLIIL